MLDVNALALRSVYGCGEHACAHCTSRRTALNPATERQASVASGIEAGDLICVTSAAVFTADADSIDEMVLDAETGEDDGAEDIARELVTRGYHGTARILRESTGDARVGALAEIRHALPGIVRAAGVAA